MLDKCLLVVALCWAVAVGYSVDHGLPDADQLAGLVKFSEVFGR